jgi:hypothetical protein
MEIRTQIPHVSRSLALTNVKRVGDSSKPSPSEQGKGEVVAGEQAIHTWASEGIPAVSPLHRTETISSMKHEEPGVASREYDTPRRSQQALDAYRTLQEVSQQDRPQPNILGVDFYA